MADLSVDPSGNPACSTRKTMGWLQFAAGLLLAAGDVWLNAGTSVQALLTFASGGPILYGLNRANNEYQIRKNNGG